METRTEAAFVAYVECALWSSTLDDDGEPMDGLYGPGDVAPEAAAAMRADVAAFLAAAGDDVDELEPAQVGHDFWLTRNHHGAGFWDRGLGDAGDRLTALAHSFGECNLYDRGGQVWADPMLTDAGRAAVRS